MLKELKEIRKRKITLYIFLLDCLLFKNQKNMGYMKSHSIIVQHYNKKEIEKFRLKAVKIFNHLVSEIIDSRINSVYSFYIAPDGSKEGWDNSDTIDNKREEFIKYIKNKCRYVELYFADDNKKSEVLKHN